MSLSARKQKFVEDANAAKELCNTNSLPFGGNSMTFSNENYESFSSKSFTGYFRFNYVTLFVFSTDLTQHETWRVAPCMSNCVMKEVILPWKMTFYNKKTKPLSQDSQTKIISVASLAIRFIVLLWMMVSIFKSVFTHHLPHLNIKNDLTFVNLEQ